MPCIINYYFIQIYEYKLRKHSRRSKQFRITVSDDPSLPLALESKFETRSNLPEYFTPLMLVQEFYEKTNREMRVAVRISQR